MRLLFLGPFDDGVASELGAVVEPQCGGPTLQLGQLLQQSDGALVGIEVATSVDVQIPSLNSTNEANVARWLMANRKRIENAMKELRERWLGALSGLGGTPGCCFSLGGPPPGE